MGNKNEIKNYEATDEIKIDGKVFVVNQIFKPKQTKQEAWLAIITRAESMKPTFDNRLSA